MKKSPRVSVVLSVFNGEKFLAEAIESVLSQTFSDFEFLMVDDCSTDGTAEIISAYGRKDSRIRAFRNDEKKGLAASLNSCLDSVRAEFVARMDADDICLPARFEEEVAFLERHTEIVAVFSLTQRFSSNRSYGPWKEEQENLTAEQIRRALPRINCVAHPTAMIRADALRAYRYDEALQHSQDWDLWLRMISDGLKLAKLDRALLRYRVHEGSTTHSSVSDEGLARKIFVCRNAFLKKQLAAKKWGAVEEEAFAHQVAQLSNDASLQQAVELCPQSVRPEASEGTVRRLVLVFGKRDDGGSDRIIETWAREFTKCGYEVALLTDEGVLSDDFSLPPSVDRFVVARGDDYLRRIQDIAHGETADTYIIDDDFTELCYRKMLLLKLLGRRVIVVNRGAWYIAAHPGVRCRLAWSIRPSVFRLLDAVVALSKVDRAYWNWAGVESAVHIPNPLPSTTVALRTNDASHEPVVASRSELSNERVFARWEALLRSLAGERREEAERLFFEPVDAGALNGILFEQISQLLDAWLERDSSFLERRPLTVRRVGLKVLGMLPERQSQFLKGALGAVSRRIAPWL